MYFAYIPFGNCNLDIGNFYFIIQSNRKLEIGSFGVCILTYNPFGYSNLEIGNFGLLYFCTLVLLRTVPLEIRFSEIGGFGIVLSVQSEPSQCTRVDVAGGIDCYRLGLIPTVPEASNQEPEPAPDQSQSQSPHMDG